MKLIIMFTLFTSITLISAKTELKSIDDIVNYALENSITYQNSLIELQEATGDIESYINVKDSAVGVNTEYLYSGDLGITTSLTIPIIEQLDLVGNINEDLNGNINIVSKPFKDSSKVSLSENQYNLKLLNSKKTAADIKVDVLRKTLSWIITKENLEIEKLILNNIKLEYDDDKIRYESGDITLDDLQTSLINYSNSRKNLLEKEQELLNKESQMYSSIGGTLDDFILPEITIETLEDIIKNLELGQKSRNYIDDYTYKESIILMLINKIEYETLTKYKPDLQLAASIPFMSGDIKSDNISASLNFSFTLDDITADEKEISYQRYLLSIKNSELKLKEAEINYNNKIKNVESSKLYRELSEIERSQAEELLLEAELLYKAGEYSEIDLNESKILLMQSKIDLLEAHSFEYISILELFR